MTGGNAASTPVEDHYVNPAPFDPDEVRPMTAEEERYFRASGLQLFWWKFRKHRVALVSGLFLLTLYLSLPFVEMIAPYTQTHRHSDFQFAPPQPVHLFHDGSLVGPFVYPIAFRVRDIDEAGFPGFYETDKTKPQRLRFFCTDTPYKLWGMIDGSFHLVCPPAGGTLFLLGTDRLGRDMFSRIIYGARISLTVGLVGIIISFAVGLTLGGLAGYVGGFVDAAIMRVIEVLRSIPDLPLWMALSAALPVSWSPILVFLGITVILGLLDWPGLALAVRAKLKSLRNEDFVHAAELSGASRGRIIRRHLLPNFMGHLIASATLSIPSMILGETALSFLGLGLRQPVVSWGVLLNTAQNMGAAAVTLYPWMLTPMIPVMLVVLAFNFLGDGLRDAADPYQ